MADHLFLIVLNHYQSPVAHQMSLLIRCIIGPTATDGLGCYTDQAGSAAHCALTVQRQRLAAVQLAANGDRRRPVLKVVIIEDYLELGIGIRFLCGG